jgi:hypothetical protein
MIQFGPDPNYVRARPILISNNIININDSVTIGYLIL